MFKHANTFEAGDAVRIKRGEKAGQKVAAEHCEGHVSGFSGGQFRVTTKSGAIEFVDITDLERI